MCYFNSPHLSGHVRQGLAIDRIAFRRYLSAHTAMIRQYRTYAKLALCAAFASCATPGRLGQVCSLLPLLRDVRSRLHRGVYTKPTGQEALDQEGWAQITQFIRPKARSVI